MCTEKRSYQPKKLEHKLELAMKHRLKVTKKNIGGCRIINLDRLQDYTDSLASHSRSCTGSITLSGEKRDGLASILTSSCSTCDHKITLATSNKVKGPRNYTRWECNLAAVWGQMMTGGGHRKLEETMSIVGVPVMTKTSFVSTERDIGEWWEQELQKSMEEAGKEERELAIRRGDYHEGVPAITVIVDGGWSKRSHRHSYNANSGVGIIIGKETGKLLFLGVRNKYCSACARNIPQEKHRCYRNWNASSSEMETDAILEGFLEAERVHGVRYTKFIGDGDSSVYPTLLQNVPGWGHAIQKLECANHACKCYRGALERLVQDNPSYKGSGGLTAKMRKRLVSSARCAIKMRSREEDPKRALELLRRDLLNGPRHCFGLHESCSPDFCSTAREQSSASTSPPSIENSSNESTEIQDEEDNADDNSITDIASSQEQLWRETLEDPATEDEVRRGGLTPTNIDQKLLFDIQALLNRLVGKARQLLSNETTNLAESWMNVRAKFDGGKFVNRSQSGSWQHRCMGAALKHNMGDKWAPEAWKNMTNSSPNKVFSDTAEHSAKILNKDRKRKATTTYIEARRRSKYRKLDDNSAAARKAYSRHDDGILPDDIIDDVSPEELKELKSEFYQTKVIVTREEAKVIEQQTRSQFDSDLWRSERRKRLTASNTGAIAKMRAKTKRNKKVQELLYPTFKGNKATTYGSEKEAITKQEYITYQRRENHSDLSVDNCGLYISAENNWLAASPDGIVHDSTETAHPLGTLEIKNPYSLRDKDLATACSTSSFCLEEDKINHRFRLKRQHNYYFQVQCQIYCVDTQWCDFVLRTNKDLHIERIYRDEEWWNGQLGKLKKFYFDALLPELASPR